jgi:predicted Zn-dependent protease
VEETDARRFRAAQGYSELGMFADALAELEGLEETMRKSPAALEMRALILVRAKRHTEALATAHALCEAAPESAAGFVHAAFCLHELGRTAEAKELLLAAPRGIENEPVFHYNLACYECALGNLDTARAHLEECFAMDKKYREFAKTDPDLAALESR